MTAVQKALKEWGGDKNLITHVVSHSTTGWDVPGLSHHVMYNLELPTSARAVPVNFVGCQGGDKNLITHVVSHSTTGWDVPGLSHHVMYNLELPTSARAVPVNFV